MAELERLKNRNNEKTFESRRKNSPGFAAKNWGGGGGGGKRIPRAPPGGNVGGGGGGGGMRIDGAAAAAATTGVPNSGSSFCSNSCGFGSLHRLTGFDDGSEKRIRRRSKTKVSLSFSNFHRFNLLATEFLLVQLHRHR